MRGALTIAGRDFRARLRDRSAILVAFVAPLVLAAILSAALGGPQSFSTRVAVADLDGGPAAEAFVEQVLGSPSLRDVVIVDSVADEEAVRAAVSDGTAGAGYVLPEGFSRAASAGQRTALTVVTSSESPVAAEIAQSLATAFAGRLDVHNRVADVVTAAEADLRRLPEILQAAASSAPAVELATSDLEASRANAASYFGPAMAIFFVFFVVALGPASLLRERRQGTLARLLAAPIRPAAILAGKALAVFALAATSIAVMWVVTVVVFDATWGDPAGVILLSLAVVLAAAGVTALIATLARTDQQVDGWTSIVVFTFALLGGSFSNVADMPAALQRLSLLTPNGWAMRGFVDLAAGRSAAAVAGPVAAISLFAVVTLAIAAIRSRRLVRP